MRRAEGDAVAFRHEIARVAIEEAMTPDRRLVLNRLALPALAAHTYDLARLAHHAEAAGDGAAVLRYAPAAGERAASLGAHREAAAQFARALRFGDGLRSEQRAALLERRSYECYLTDELGEAIAARRQALAIHHARFDRLLEGDAHRWLSRLAWFAGDTPTATREGERAVAVLEPLTPSPELAMAYSNMSQLRMLAGDLDGTRHWGERAIALAERLLQTETLVHALNNVGTAELTAGVPEGAAKLERSLELALKGGYEEHVARAYTNLATTRIPHREYAIGDPFLEAGLAYVRERDIDAWVLYLSGWLARSRFEQGRWEEAEELASSVIAHPGVSATSKITALFVLGRLRARRGEPGVWEPLDEAKELAMATMEPQRVLPVAAARAEARLLAGEPERVREEIGDALALTPHHGEGWAAGELCVLARRAGVELTPPVEPAEPFRLELAGEFEAAADAWSALGCPYEEAQCRSRT
jgi:tetratricopeptide (TPR) repeat protein